VEKLWLGGRTAPLPVYGLAPTLRVARALLDAFEARAWPGLFEIVWTEIAERPFAPVVDDDVFEVVASPVVHAVPTVGLRVAFKPTGRAFAYSCDTEPCANVVALARGVHLLVHEATGEGRGHTSAVQAAHVAREARAARLVLVHLPPGGADDGLHAARAVFPHTTLGEDGVRLRV